MPTAASKPTTESVVGIVLAAGAGRRMGGPKALIGPLARHDRTPLARVCSWVHEAGCGRVIAVIGAQADAVRAALASDGVLADALRTDAPLAAAPLADVPHGAPGRGAAGFGVQGRLSSRADACWLSIVEAADWELGMGASLRAGLRAAELTPAASALVTLVDLPDVSTPIYARVLAEAGPDADALARAAFDGRPGHPVVLGRQWWDAAAASAVGDQGARGLFASTPHRLIECGHLGTGQDADTPN